jgi:uncharacterized membrane protein
MRIKLSTSLVYLNIFILIFLCVTFFNSNNSLPSIPLIILGIPFVLFSPGYALTVALFPRNEDLSFSKRLAFSFGLSLIIVPILGLILNYTPFGIKVISVVTSLASFAWAASIIAVIRLRKLREDDQKPVEKQSGMTLWGHGRWDMVFTVLMIIFLLGVVPVFTYFFSNPRTGETYTQFYINPVGSTNGDFPKELQVGELLNVNVAIGNHEGAQTNYRLQVLIDGSVISEKGPITVADGQTWNDYLLVFARHTGDDQKMEFILYKNSDSRPYLNPLYVWLNVK